MSERCTACSAPSALNEVVRSVSQTQVLRKRAIAAFPGRQKQNCVASLKSQVQAPQALLGQQQENFKVYKLTVITIITDCINLRTEVYTLLYSQCIYIRSRATPTTKGNIFSPVATLPFGGVWDPSLVPRLSGPRF